MRKIMLELIPEELKLLCAGIKSYMPWSNNVAWDLGGEPHDITYTARYCYSLWIRHIVMAYKNNLPTRPEVLYELGPGDSIGVGLAALLTGTRKYTGFEVVNYSGFIRNNGILDELLKLFNNRENIPGESEFPLMYPRLESYKFPSYIFNEERLRETLRSDRVESIRDALFNLGAENKDGIRISYIVPWHDSEQSQADSVDMAFSQGVLEFPRDLLTAYKNIARWLKPGGFTSNQIDFRGYATAKEWNICWTYPDFIWKLMDGKRVLGNREPHSTHIKLLKQIGFEVVCDIIIKEKGVPREKLVPRFRNISDEDLITRAAFIQAAKRS